MPGDGPALWRIGPIRITTEGLLGGVRYALRLSTAAFVFALLLATTPINLLVRALEKLGLPYTLSMTMGLALRYMTALIDLYHTISEAQQARGWDLSQRTLLRLARAAVPTLVAVIISALRLSDALALGLAARGFGMNRPRTVYRDICMTRRDWLALLVSGLLCLLGLLFVISQ
jgi:energy-coupling factor transport system permease protein